MYACENGNLDIVKLLVENGAEINAKDSTDWTPLFHAVSYENFNIIKYLVEHGPEIDITDTSGDKLIEVSSNKKIVSYLKSKIKND